MFTYLEILPYLMNTTTFIIVQLFYLTCSFSPYNLTKHHAYLHRPPSVPYFCLFLSNSGYHPSTLAGCFFPFQRFLFFVDPHLTSQSQIPALTSSFFQLTLHLSTTTPTAASNHMFSATCSQPQHTTTLLHTTGNATAHSTKYHNIIPYTNTHSTTHTT